ncbi:isoflavone reductase [Corynespora cassiicola Philippines]|uniref:Isoflavone reductase n=1 Tax=Corynespora cassiicola Philippines TaxID=1448308 RepID=A0A2T2PBR6_CORCC|nr:isoflavone reductase [Corynespora cassiicola Philippines]
MSVFKNVMLIGYTVTVLSRQDSTSTFPPTVRLIRADYSSGASLTAAIQGQDVVITMVGGAVVGDQNPLIDAAVAAGVKRFLPSEFGPDTLQPGTHKIIPSLPAKVQTVNYLREKEPNMEWTSIITGGWLDWGLKGGHYPFDFRSRTATIIDGGETTFTTTTLSKVGKAILAVLEHAEMTRNKYVYVSSFNINQIELLRALEKVDGRKWDIRHETSEELIKKGKEIISKGDYAGTGSLVKALMFGNSGLGDSRPGGLWDEKLGLESEDLEQTLRSIVSEI